MTKTIVLTLLMTAAAHHAGAQPVPTPAPAPVAEPAPFVFATPPAVPVLPDFDVQLPVVNFPAVPFPDVQFPEVSFPEVNFGDVSFQVDAAMKGAAKAMEKLPKVMASLQNPVPAPPAPPARLPGPFKFGGNEENIYDQARNMIEREQYDRALDALDRVIELKGTRVDAAMYWKAYTLSKLSRRPEALTTLSDLQKQFPNGQWVRDAKALEVEVRQASGQSVSADSVDEDLKVMALRALMQSNSEQALPQVEKLLQGSSSVRVKQSALILLSQSSNPRARAALVNVAKNGSNPDLRLSAIRYMGNRNDPETAQALDEIYRSTSDRDLKQQILRSFMSSNAIDKLAAVARTEKDEELQKTAIRSLGSSNRSEAAEALRLVYTSDASVDVKKSVIDGLSMQRSPTVLIGLARSEKNLELKKYMVQRLGNNSRSAEVQQFLGELLDDKK